MLGYHMVGNNHLNKRPVRIQKASKHWQPFENRTLKNQTTLHHLNVGAQIPNGLRFWMVEHSKTHFF